VDARAVTPKSLILDLLRVSGSRALPVSGLVQVGAIFGLSGNALRVAVARLAATGLVESDERGFYRLAPRTDALNQHVEEWRLGEKRVRRWSSAWLAVWRPARPDRSARRPSLRALTLSGFREALGSLWLRPDNLARPKAELAQHLHALGLEEQAELLTLSELSPRLSARLEADIWDVQRLVAGYRELARALIRSSARVPDLPVESALVETFQLGGSAIRALATDPLLPNEMLPTSERKTLTDAMLEYDALGRKTWARVVGGMRFAGSPSHVSAGVGLEGSA
jgi:phenylacetic acid degradation operon negative regulatory protein